MRVTGWPTCSPPTSPVPRLQGAVLPWVEPAAGVRDAAASCAQRPVRAPVQPQRCRPFRAEQLAEHFAQLVQVMLDRGLNLHDPRYIGHQVPAPVPLGGLFDAVGR